MKNIGGFVSNVSQSILRQVNVLILISTGQKSAWSQFLLNVNKFPTGWSWEKIQTIFQWYF